jgi:hypothetical protein
VLTTMIFSIIAAVVHKDNFVREQWRREVHTSASTMIASTQPRFSLRLLMLLLPLLLLLLHLVVIIIVIIILIIILIIIVVVVRTLLIHHRKIKRIILGAMSATLYERALS